LIDKLQSDNLMRFRDRRVEIGDIDHVLRQAGATGDGNDPEMA